MTRLLLGSLCLALLAGCGAQPMAPALSAPSLGFEADARHGNVYTLKDIPAICEAVAHDHAKAKANKTNCARLGTIMAHVQTLAEDQKQKKAVALAKAALAQVHVLNQQAVKEGRLSTVLAEKMKETLMKAFSEILAAVGG